MAFEQRSLDDYIDVAQRIADFREKFPEGTLAPLNPAEPYRFMQAMGWEAPKDGSKEVMQSFVVVVAAAYRHPGDPNPGVGMAWEIFPGRTPYTRGSELQNAETSAWGRAIIAVGASDSKRGIASREEVRNRQAEREDAPSVCGVCFHASHAHQYGGQRCQIIAEGEQCGCAQYMPLPRNADGSLSRSRTTDDQKAAAGVMTSAQQAEHTQIAKPPPNAQAVERLSTTPDDDSFYQPRPLERAKPAGWLLSERFAALGVYDRKERLDQCSEIIGRPITSSKDLEAGEIAAILEALQKRELAPDAH